MALPVFKSHSCSLWLYMENKKKKKHIVNIRSYFNCVHFFLELNGHTVAFCTTKQLTDSLRAAFTYAFNYAVAPSAAWRIT